MTSGEIAEYTRTTLTKYYRSLVRTIWGTDIMRPILWLCLAGVMLTRPLRAAPPTGADPNSEIGRWFQSLLNSKGEICCSIADCRRPYAWRQTGRGYQVQEGNGAPWLDVPPENILHRKNPLGDAVACIVGGRVRCFVPPSEI